MTPQSQRGELQQPALDDEQRDAVYRAISERRDVRQGFLAQPLPEDLWTRLLSAAHNAPSVGLMQPSRYVVIRSREVRARIHAAFCEANKAAQEIYTGAKREHYASLKLEGILEAPQNLCIVCDPGSERRSRHLRLRRGHGRSSMWITDENATSRY